MLIVIETGYRGMWELSNISEKCKGILKEKVYLSPFFVITAILYKNSGIFSFNILPVLYLGNALKSSHFYK